MKQDQQRVMLAEDIDRSLSRVALQIVERNRDLENLAIVGIHTGGVFLAQRLRGMIEERESVQIPLGTLDISLYRDDWSLATQSPVVKMTDLGFSVENCTLVVVDDVLFTGRTIRAAMDAIMDFGRPRSIQLAVLIDRGGRELPIQPDFVGMHLSVEGNERIDVLLREHSGVDEVVLDSSPLK
ncbi:MAG: bifunctional pyr operon transcriptional regulator/uracil phosphoribosyltransferase PyrR [Proteobacteria bacterium]|nr:bifunctional pyr operon transcriptional regulator/uracil phosphoribosyltransferase PyrR [Pseudomonadota bacterium]MBU1686713.1 bifunctional pyr operon transcriptional regulator/uracil phosphoribosyltransferase PyrR [Pseudomonadota bacterium]